MMGNYTVYPDWRDEQTLHREVLKLLGYNIISQYWEEEIDIVNEGTYYKLALKDKVLSEYYEDTEDEVWAQAPELRDLRDALEMAILIQLGTIHTSCEVSTDGIEIMAWTKHELEATGSTPAYALAGIFVNACERGLINPDKVMFP